MKDANEGNTGEREERRGKKEEGRKRYSRSGTESPK